MLAVAGLVPAIALAGSSHATAAYRGDQAAAGFIATVAGGVGGPARATQVAVDACGVSYAGGRLYVASLHSVRTVDPSTGKLTTLAGTGVRGLQRNGAPTARAAVTTCGTTVDNAGNVLIADTGLDKVRVIPAHTGAFYGQNMTAGHIYTIAGNGRFGFSGDGGPATSARLWLPSRVTVDGAGDVLIADTDNNRIRIVAAHTATLYGQSMTADDIYTIAGNGTQGFSGDGGPATSAELSTPQDMAVDSAGDVLIADTDNGRIRIVAAHSGTLYGQSVTADHIYTIAGGGASNPGDGGPATQAKLIAPEGVALDGSGNPLIADTFDNRIRIVAASTGTFYGQHMTAGDIYTIAGNGTEGFSGDGGPATGAELNIPRAATVDSAGDVLIADTSNDRVRIVAARTGTRYGQHMTAGDIYTIAGNGTAAFSGDGGPATRAELNDPFGITVDSAGDQLIADWGNERIRMIPASTGTHFGQSMTAGDIYTIAGNGTKGYSGDGGPATRAELNGPQDVAVDGDGNVLIADSQDHRIRVVAAHTGTFYGQSMTAGDIYTIAGNGTKGYSGDGGPATSAELSFPYDVTVDGAGNVLIADTFNNRIRIVAARTATFYGQNMTAGDIYTIAGGGRGDPGDGGPATQAKLITPYGLALDGSGNILISASFRIRVVAASNGTFYGQSMTAGHIYTIAGNGNDGFSGDGGPATNAELNNSYGLAVDGAGNVVIADTQNNRIRLVAAATSTFYGQSMTAGHIYTIAGNGTAGFFGDGGHATGAALRIPEGVAVDGAGNVLIADTDNARIRAVAH